MADIKNLDITTTVTDALIDVFDMMLSIELELTDDDSMSIPEGERIVGSVSLAGRVMGAINIEVSHKFARLMTAAMQDKAAEDVDEEDDIRDVISEVCNIVGGNLKSTFCDAGLICDLSPPSFTTGDDFRIESLNIERYEKYSFSHEKHNVIVEVGVRIDETAEIDAEVFAMPEKELKPVAVEDVENFDIHTPLIDSMKDLFDTMLSMELESSDKDLKSALTSVERVVGSVSLVGPLMGSVNIHVGGDFSRKMTAAMLGIGVDDIQGEEELKDVLSEVCNIVGGNLKSKLCDNGMHCDLSTPCFTAGSSFSIEAKDMVRYERLSFVYQENVVFVEVVLKTAGEARSKDAETGKVSDGEEPLGAGQDPQEMIDQVMAVEGPADDAGPGPGGASGSGNGRGRGESGPNDEINEKNMDFIFNIPVEINAELGRTRWPVKELLKLGKGSVIELAQLDGEPVDLLVNDTLVAKGEIVVERQKYGVRILETISRMERIRSLR
jgi:flagellar motor switch protein FliN